MNRDDTIGLAAAINDFVTTSDDPRVNACTEEVSGRLNIVDGHYTSVSFIVRSGTRTWTITVTET